MLILILLIRSVRQLFFVHSDIRVSQYLLDKFLKLVFMSICKFLLQLNFNLLATMSKLTMSRCIRFCRRTKPLNQRKCLHPLLFLPLTQDLLLLLAHEVRQMRLLHLKQLYFFLYFIFNRNQLLVHHYRAIKEILVLIHCFLVFLQLLLNLLL